jgi:hypothetical protein
VQTPSTQDKLSKAQAGGRRRRWTAEQEARLGCEALSMVQRARAEKRRSRRWCSSRADTVHTVQEAAGNAFETLKASCRVGWHVHCLPACLLACFWRHHNHAGLEGSWLPGVCWALRGVCLRVAWVVNGEIDVALGSSPSAEGEYWLPNMSPIFVPELPSAICHLAAGSPPPTSTLLLPTPRSLSQGPSSQPFMRPRR